MCLNSLRKTPINLQSVVDPVRTFEPSLADPHASGGTMIATRSKGLIGRNDSDPKPIRPPLPYAVPLGGLTIKPKVCTRSTL